MSRLEAFLAKAVHAHSQNNSAHLGDRSLYVGASDIAACPRKAVLSKLRPVPHTIKQQLIFARGHAAQKLYSDIFHAGGVTFEEEVELVHPDNPRVKCHIDFLFTGKGRLHVVEMKSTDGIPDEPYGSWVEQLHVQMGLARLRYDKQLEIGGSILCVDLNTGEYKEFNSFKPDQAVFDYLMQKADHMLLAHAGQVEARCEPGFLCGGHCPYRTDCSAFAGAIEIPEEVADTAALHLALSGKKKLIDGELDALKNNLLAFTGERSFKGQCNELSFITTYFPPSETVDGKKLKAHYPEAYAACKKTKAGYTKLEVRRLPPVPVAEERQAA